MAANVAVPNTFSNGAAADATAVNANFAALVNWINTNAVHLDGSKPTTGILTGPASDPTSANQYTRKAYVDAQDAAEVAARNAAIAATANPTRVGWVLNYTSGGTVANATSSTFTWNSESLDTDGFIPTPSTNVTVPAGKGGLYALAASSWVSGASPGQVAISIWVNGSVQHVGGVAFIGAGVYGGTVSGILFLNAGDVITVKIYNNGPGSITIGTPTFFEGVRVSI